MIWTIVIGLFVGTIAKMLMPGKDPAGFIFTIALGIAGSILAYWLGMSQGWYMSGQPVGFIASIFGSLLLLSVYRVLA
ncbi:MAG: GlsB/YeaQ/YmgE family stress response membrane protein [Bdellovibrionota bacterium]